MRLSSIPSVQALVRAAFWLGLAAFAAACTTGSRDAAPPSNQAAQGPRTDSNGTGDSTGGNGINGKPFESYIVEDITTLPEWKEWIAPIEAHFDSMTAYEEGKHGIERLARTKKWFFVPLELNKIPKNRLGVDFIQDPVQQLALQSRDEIWVDSLLYDKASTRDRALLLMHELIVGYYQQRFENIEDLCSKYFTCGSPADVAKLAKMDRYKPEARRALVESDYQNIRAVTSEVFNRYREFKTDGAFSRILLAHHFDSRFYNTKSQENREAMKLKVTPVKETVLVDWLRAQIQLGEFPTFLSRDAARLKSEEIEMDLDENSRNLRIHAESGVTSFDFANLFFGDDREFDSSPVVMDEEASSYPMVCSSPVTWAQYQKIEEGQIFPSYCLYLSPQPHMAHKEGEPYALDGLRIEALTVSFYQVVSVKTVDGAKQVKIGKVSPQKRPSWIFTREELPKGAKAAADVNSGNSYDLNFTVKPVQ